MPVARKVWLPMSGQRPGLDAGGLRPPLDHAVGVLLPQSVAGELARSARRGLEQGRVRVLRDAGRGDIFVQIPLTKEKAPTHS